MRSNFDFWYIVQTMPRFQSHVIACHQISCPKTELRTVLRKTKSTTSEDAMDEMFLNMEQVGKSLLVMSGLDG